MLRIFLVLLLTLSALFAEKITHFHVDVTIEPGGELAVTENIDYNFETTRRHGIFRDIPSQIKYNGVVKDIGLYDFTVEMDGHPVNWQKSTWHAQHAGEIIRLKIGDAATLLSGEHRYTIQYRVKKGVLPAAQNPRNDALRWNIVGTGWGVPIYDIRATFHLPENLTRDHIALSTYTGRYGANATNARTQWRDDRTLEVYISHLEPYEGATVELAFPAGILGQSGLDNVEQSVWERFFSQWHWAALVGYLLYFFEARKKYTGFVDKRSVAVQYLPPKGLSLLQSGLLLDKHADSKDFAAAILELAQLGYIEIEQPGSRTDPILKRTDKLPKGLTKDQQYLLAEVLFPGEKKHFVMKQATPQSARRLKTALDHINNNLYTWSVEAGYMAENPQKTRKHFLTKSALLMLPVAALTFYTLFRQMGMDAIFVLVFPVVFGMAGVSMLLSRASFMQRIMGLLFAGAGFIPAILVPQQYGLSLSSLIIGPLGVFVLLVAALSYVYKQIGRYTQRGAYAHKQLLGLQEFIKRVKEDEIKRRLALDPLYLERLLPYAMLFGETRHWLDLFKVLNVSLPLWYHGHIDDIAHFDNAMRHTTTPPVQSSAGGGFSGGDGFSGGGGGGGGGGSW